MNRSRLKIQGIPMSYDEAVEEITEYIKSRIDFWNEYVAYDDDDKIKLIDVQLHGSRLRNQAREDSDLDCVFEYQSETAREDDVFNYFAEEDEDEKCTLYGIPVDFNPIRSDDMGPMEDYMRRSDEYDRKKIAANEAVETLREAGYIVEDFKSKLGKVAAIGALAAGAAFGNTGMPSNRVGPNAVPGDTIGFGKTSVHLQQRYNYPSTRYGVPKSFKLPKGETKFQISHKQELELTKAKILATPDSVLHKYGKAHLTEIANIIIQTATKYNLDIDMLLAVAGTETGYDPGNDSKKNATGMMQITPAAAYDIHTRLLGKDSITFDFNDFKDFKANVDYAGRMLADLSKRRNNVIEMIWATYNGGTKQATAWRYAQLGKTKFDDGKPVPKLAN